MTKNRENPMNWDCEESGCWCYHNKPRTEKFADCWGVNGINFSDIDSIVERNNLFLVLEWKARNAKVRTGQRMLLEALTRTGLFTAIIVNAEDIPHSKIRSIQLVTPAGIGDEIPCDFATLKTIFKNWWDWAEADLTKENAKFSASSCLTEIRAAMPKLNLFKGVKGAK